MGRGYDKEFREKIIKLRLEQGRTFKSLAKEHGVSESTIERWVVKHRNKRGV